MNWIRRWRERRTLEREMREEMEFHLENRAATLRAQGLDAKEAIRRARLEFGSQPKYEEEARAELGYRPFDELCSDLRFALRGLRKQPGYALTTIAILACAIGANSAFFTLFSQHVLEPLPIRAPQRHFDLISYDRESRSAPGWTRAEVDALRQAARDDIEGFYSLRTFQVLAVAPIQRLSLVSIVSPSFFPLTGRSATQGRVFIEAEDHQPVAVLSDSGARHFFPGLASPVGKQLRVRNTVLTVTGVMPPDFTGTEAIVPDFWIPSGMDAAVSSSAMDREPRFDLSGILKPQARPASVEALLSATASRFARTQDDAVSRVHIEMRPGRIAVTDEFKLAAALVFAIFLMVLIIACANLANLCLARAAARTHEIAMRLSLGASRARIVRQLLTESTFVAVFGAAAGVLFGAVCVQQAEQWLMSYAGTLGITMLPAHLDLRVLAFSGALGILAGLAFGLLPAIEVTAPSLTLSTKRENSFFAGRIRPRRLRSFLMTSQIASSLVLLITAGILVHHIHGLTEVATGFDLDHTFDLRLEQPQPALLQRLEQLPAVAGVSAVERVPLGGGLSSSPAQVEGRSVQLVVSRVDAHYFSTADLSIDGRGFTQIEGEQSAQVAVISRATAQRLWPGRSPLGQVFSLLTSPKEGPVTTAGTEAAPQVITYTVIGVAPDVVSGFLFRGLDPTAVYLPGAAGQQQLSSVLVRVHGDPGTTIAAIRQICATTSSSGGCEPISLRDISGMQRFPFQAAAVVSAALGALALGLSAIGLYSMTSFSVTQRRREIGIYLALGATVRQVLQRIFREALHCGAMGLAIGIPVCLILSALANASVLGIEAWDTTVYLTIPAVLIATAAIACALPARRAAKTDPMLSLREE